MSARLRVRVYRVRHCWCGHTAVYLVVAERVGEELLTWVCRWHRDRLNWPSEGRWSVPERLQAVKPHSAVSGA